MRIIKDDSTQQQPVRVEWRWKWGPFVDDVDNHGFINKELPSDIMYGKCLVKCSICWWHSMANCELFKEWT